MPGLPSLFIASSTKGLNVANAIYDELVRNDNVVVPKVWNQGLFRLGDTFADRLIEIAETYDFAVLVFSPDDIVLSGGMQKPAARDNVVFELGLFAGQLGRERAFAVVHAPELAQLPSDFAGVTTAKYTIERDDNGKEVPSVALACHEIMDVVERLGKLRHPMLEVEKTLEAIVQNHRLAFRIEHPLFQEYLRRWCQNERDDSEYWRKGMLRVKVDFADIFQTLYQNAQKNIFSVSIPASRSIWNEPWGRRLLQTQKDHKNAKSTRVFVYPSSASVTEDDKRVMQQHNQAGVAVRVCFEPKDSAFSYETERIENEWSMIDDGEAIGITKRIEPGAMEVHWSFDPKQKHSYERLRDRLVNRSDTLDDWQAQQRSPSAA